MTKGGEVFSKQSLTPYQTVPKEHSPKMEGGLMVAGPSLVRTEVITSSNEYDGEVLRKIDDHWERMRQRNPALFDGTVWDMKDYRVEGDQVGLSVQQTSYKYFAYSHFSSCPEFNVNAIGVSALVTHGSKILLGKRSPTLAACPGQWHLIPAGTLDQPNVVQTILKELEEELGVSHVKSMRFLGLFDSGREQCHKPEVVFHIELDCTVEELEKSYATAIDNREHTEIRLIGEELPNFLSSEPVVDVTRSILKYYKTLAK